MKKENWWEIYNKTLVRNNHDERISNDVKLGAVITNIISLAIIVILSIVYRNSLFIGERIYIGAIILLLTTCSLRYYIVKDERIRGRLKTINVCITFFIIFEMTAVQILGDKNYLSKDFITIRSAAMFISIIFFAIYAVRRKAFNIYNNRKEATAIKKHIIVEGVGMALIVNIILFVMQGTAITFSSMGSLFLKIIAFFILYFVSFHFITKLSNK